MECLANREESFTKGKRYKWPHGSKFIATPATLAAAGFRFAPSADDRDNVACFICDKNLGDWEPEDDPFELHWSKCGQNNQCAWAVVRCAGDLDKRNKSEFRDKQRIPTSKPLEKARLATFKAGKGWKHDKVKHHGASSKQMAAAGFVFAPQEPGDDTASCLYCEVVLNGWDEDDNPIEEHRKRSGTSCPFFTVGAPSSKPASKASSRTVNRGKDFYEDVEDVMTKTYDGSSDEDTPSFATSATAAKTPARKGRGRTGAKTPSSRTVASAKTPSRRKSRSRSVATTEDDGEDVTTTAVRKRKGRSRSTATTEEEDLPPRTPATVKRKPGRPPKVVALTDEDDVDVPPPTTAKRRTRKKSVARTEDDQSEPVPPPTEKKKKRGRSKSVVRTVDDDDPFDSVPVNIESAASQAKKKRGRGKSVPPTDDEEMPAPVAPPAEKKVKNRSVSVTSSVNGDNEALPTTLKSRAKSKGRSVSSSSKRAPTPLSDYYEPARSQPQTEARSPSPSPPPLPKPKARKKSVLRARSVGPDPENPEEYEDNEDVFIPPPLVVQTSAKPAKTRHRSRSVVRSDVPSEDEVPPEKPNARSRSKSIVRNAAPPDMDILQSDMLSEDEVPPPKAKARSRSKSVVRSTAPGDADMDVDRALLKSSRSRPPSRSAAAPATLESDPDESAIIITKPPTVTPYRAPSLNKKNSKSHLEEDVVVDDEEVPAKSRSATTRIKSKKSTPLEVEDETPDPVVSRPPSRATSNSKARGRAEEEEIARMETDEVKASRATSRPPSRTGDREHNRPPSRAGAAAARPASRAESRDRQMSIGGQMSIGEREREHKSHGRPASRSTSRPGKSTGVLQSDGESENLLLEQVAALKTPHDDRKTGKKKKESAAVDEKKVDRKISSTGSTTDKSATAAVEVVKPIPALQAAAKPPSFTRSGSESGTKPASRASQQEGNVVEILSDDEQDAEVQKPRKQKPRTRKISSRPKASVLASSASSKPAPVLVVEPEPEPEPEVAPESKLVPEPEPEAEPEPAPEPVSVTDLSTLESPVKPTSQPSPLDHEEEQEDVEMDEVAEHVLSPAPATPPRNKPARKSRMSKEAIATYQEAGRVLAQGVPHYPKAETGNSHILKEGPIGNTNMDVSMLFSGDVTGNESMLAPPFEEKFYPALASAPFENVTQLSEKELDMTVEEWIRWQIELEYERFKEDALREFRKFEEGAESRRELFRTMEVAS